MNPVGHHRLPPNFRSRSNHFAASAAIWPFLLSGLFGFIAYSPGTPLGGVLSESANASHPVTLGNYTAGVQYC